MKSTLTLREIIEAAGTDNGKGEVQKMALVCGVRFTTARNWYYYGKAPRYPAVEKVKKYALRLVRSRVGDAQVRAQLEAAIRDLYRNAA